MNIPHEHKLPFAVFASRREGMNVYEAMAFWKGMFDNISFIGVWLKQEGIWPKPR